MKMRLVFGLVVAVSLCGLAQGQNLELIRKGKQATALVVVKQGTSRGWGSAFCISSAGYFVTNAHVIPESHLQTLLAPSGFVRVVVPGRGIVMMPRVRTVTRNVSITLSLVLNPGEANQAIYPAHVVRLDRSGDLAVLVINAKDPLPTLEIGQVTGLFETAPVTAFGYPFGQMLAEKDGDFPSITVSTGRITSLRKTKGELSAIQLDAALNPGNSGGPVLDDKGRIIGIVEKGIPGASVNFAIPATRLSDFLKSPLATLSAPSISPAAATNQTEFTIRVLSPSAAEMQRATVNLELTGEDGKVRTLAAKKVRDQVFTVTTAAALNPVEASAPETESQTQPASGPAAAQPTVPFAVIIKQSGKPDVRTIGHITFVANATPTMRTTWLAIDRTVAEAEATEAAAHNPPGVRATARSGLPTVARPDTPITVAALGAQKVLDLSGPIDEMVTADGGRVIVMWIGARKQLAFFDASTQKLDYAALDTERPLLAGTSDKLLVVLPDRGVIERWSLATHNRELSKPLTDASQLCAIAAGESGQGPLLIAGGVRLEFLDPMTLAPAALQYSGRLAGELSNPTLRATASADGSSFLLTTAIPPQTLHVLSIDGKTIHEKLATHNVGEIKPAPDGRTFIGLHGILDANLAPARFTGSVLAYAPVHGAPMFVGWRPNGTGLSTYLFSSADRSRLLELPAMQELRGTVPMVYTVPDVFDRLNVIPSAKVIVNFDVTGTHLVIRDFDIDKQLQAAGGTHLFVTSVPPRAIARGATLDYKIDVSSGQGGVSYSLQSGPTGMTISADGHICWKAPMTASAVATPIIIVVKDKSGREIYHNFEIWVS